MPPYLGSWETDIVGSIIYADAISLSYMKDRGYGCDEASAKPWLKKPSVGSTVGCPSFPRMSITSSDVGGKKACQLATETLPALYRKMSLKIWKNTGQGQSQTFPGLCIVKHPVTVSRVLPNKELAVLVSEMSRGGLRTQ